MSNAQEDPAVVEAVMQELADIGQQMEQERKEYEAGLDAWWNGLSEEDREKAFYAVVKRIYEGEITKQGSYRYVLYQVFGFGPHMYSRALDAGYMEIHNSIFEFQEKMSA